MESELAISHTSEKWRLSQKWCSNYGKFGKRRDQTVKRRILTVDDDPLVQNQTRAILEASDYEVLSAGSGSEALRLLDSEERPINILCIILDVQMPDMNGFDVLTRLKLHNDTRNIPVIMLTCQTSDEDVMDGYNIGAEYYITKPFTREQLLYGIKLVTA